VSHDATNCEVLIAGAGPTGLALGCHLLRLGVPLRIVDKQPGPSTTSKAIGLQYRVSEMLAIMGVAERFLERGGTPTAINIYSGDRRLVRLNFTGFGSQSGPEAFAPRAIMIPQSETEELLGDLLRERGGQIEWNTEFVDFSQDEHAVSSRLRHAGGREELVRSRYLVSCEGAHSQVRKQAGLSFAGKTYPLLFFMADVELDWDLDHGENHVWMHADGSFAALPLPPPRRWRLFVEASNASTSGNQPRQQGEKPADANSLPPREVTLDDIRKLMHERLGSERAGISNPTWISEFRINCRMVDHYRQGRVFLAGDAAHIHSPTGGQGIATGIQDATNLAWKLARVLRGAPPALLDTYEEERLPHAREVLKETDRTTTVLFAPTPGMRLLRDLVVLPVLRNPWVQRRMFGRLSQLHVSYRHSSLSGHEDARPWPLGTRIKAGDRAPDIVLRRIACGETVTLFGLLGALKPVALLHPRPNARRDELDRAVELLQRADVSAYVVLEPSDADDRHGELLLADPHGSLRAIYGMSGEFACIIRPDGHIGLFQRPVNLERLQSYLSLLAAAEG
jgi:4,5-epoxidase